MVVRPEGCHRGPWQGSGADTWKQLSKAMRAPSQAKFPADFGLEMKEVQLQGSNIQRGKLKGADAYQLWNRCFHRMLQALKS